MLKDALDLVRERGQAFLDAAVDRVGRRLADTGTLESPEDIAWLEWHEARKALVAPGDWQSLVRTRSAAAAAPEGNPRPERIGPPLPDDAPRMYLLREVLSLLAS